MLILAKLGMLGAALAVPSTVPVNSITALADANSQQGELLEQHSFYADSNLGERKEAGVKRLYTRFYDASQKKYESGFSAIPGDRNQVDGYEGITSREYPYLEAGDIIVETLIPHPSVDRSYERTSNPPSEVHVRAMIFDYTTDEKQIKMDIKKAAESDVEDQHYLDGDRMVHVFGKTLRYYIWTNSDQRPFYGSPSRFDDDYGAWYQFAYKNTPDGWGFSPSYSSRAYFALQNANSFSGSGERLSVGPYGAWQLAKWIADKRNRSLTASDFNRAFYSITVNIFNRSPGSPVIDAIGQYNSSLHKSPSRLKDADGLDTALLPAKELLLKALGWPLEEPVSLVVKKVDRTSEFDGFKGYLPQGYEGVKKLVELVGNKTGRRIDQNRLLELYNKDKAFFDSMISDYMTGAEISSVKTNSLLSDNNSSSKKVNEICNILSVGSGAVSLATALVSLVLNIFSLGVFSLFAGGVALGLGVSCINTNDLESKGLPSGWARARGDGTKYWRRVTSAEVRRRRPSNLRNDYCIQNSCYYDPNHVIYWDNLEWLADRGFIVEIPKQN